MVYQGPTGLSTISGPSGAGKTTLLGSILKRFPQAKPLLRVTTRLKRPTDNPNEYRYVSDAEFDALVQQQAFMWHMEIHGFRHGAPRAETTEALIRGHTVGDISYRSAEILMHHAHLMERQTCIRSAYLYITDERELRRRLAARNELEVDRRIAECRSWNEAARRSFVPFEFIDARAPQEEVLQQALEFFQQS